MGESEIFEVLRASLWAGVLMGLPILGVSLVLGFAIGNTKETPRIGKPISTPILGVSLEFPWSWGLQLVSSKR